MDTAAGCRLLGPAWQGACLSRVGLGLPGLPGGLAPCGPAVLLAVGSGWGWRQSPHFWRCLASHRCRTGGSWMEKELVPRLGLCSYERVGFCAPATLRAESHTNLTAGVLCLGCCM